MRRALLLLAAVCIGGSVAAGSAWGCSCVAPSEADLREWYAESDAAMIGTLVSRRTVDEGSSKWGGDETDGFTFIVEEDFKDNLGERVEVRSSAYGASCGLEVGRGDRTGLFIDRSGGHWWSGLCNQVGPKQLREAATELPPATGEGSPILIASGKLGEPRLAAFDADGEVVRYATGNGTTNALDVCPGSHQVAEMGRNERGRTFVALRDGSTLRRSQEMRVRISQRPLPQFAYGFACRGDSDLFVFATDAERPQSTLIRISDGEQTTLHRGRAVAAAFGDESAYLYNVPRRRLVRVDLDNGRTNVVLRDLRKLAPLAVSPDGERLLAFGYRGIDPTYYGMTRLYALPLRGNGSRESITIPRRAQAWTTATWLGDDSIGLFARRETLLLDDTLETERTLPSLAGLIAIRDEAAYGLAEGTLHSMDLETGERSQLTQFPVDGFTDMVGVGGSASTTGRPRAARRANMGSCRR